MNESVTTEVRSVLIPLAASRLLLPNAVVAEVIDYQAPERRDGVPDWYLGDISWRGLSLPVVSFEALMGGEYVVPASRGRCIVLNTMSGRASLTHIVIVSQAIPSLVRVTAEAVSSPDIQSDMGDVVERMVNVNDSLALIPNLDRLEQRVLEAGSKG
jgi:chemosensory pili system protein ChpC